MKEFTVQDLKAFIAFCARPPEAWVGIQKARFIVDNDTERYNLDWKPFIRPIADPEIGYVINRFFKYSSYELNAQPRLSNVDLYRAPPDPLDDSDDYYAKQYLKYLANLYPSTTVSERSYFVFSVCYHLRIRFKELRVEYSNFSMACFSSIGSDEPYFTMRGSQRNYKIAIPQALEASLIRYRHSLGLSSLPLSSEGEPIISRALIGKLMWRLPRMPGLSRSPSDLLDRSVMFHLNQLPGQNLLSVTKRESSRQYRSNWKRKKVWMAHTEFASTKNNYLVDADYHAQPSPSPLFGMLRRDVIALSKGQSQAYASRCFPYGCLKIVLEAFEIIRTYRSCSSDRLKLVAFEKLLLWSIYVKGKSFYSLTTLDAQEFHKFCLSPPRSWTCSRSQARLVISANDISPNPKWAPFVQISDTDENKFLRAARVIDWCSNVYNTLLVNELVKINIFLGFVDNAHG